MKANKPSPQRVLNEISAACVTRQRPPTRTKKTISLAKISNGVAVNLTTLAAEWNPSEGATLAKTGTEGRRAARLVSSFRKDATYLAYALLMEANVLPDTLGELLEIKMRCPFSRLLTSPPSLIHIALLCGTIIPYLICRPRMAAQGLAR